MKSARRVALVFLFGLIGIFVQGTLIQLLAPHSLIVPNLLLVLVAYLAFHEVSVLGVVLSFMLGVQFDLASGILVGPWAASFVAVFALFSLVSQRVFVESTFAVWLAVFCAVLCANLVYLAIISLFTINAWAGVPFSFRAAIESCITALVAAPLFRVLKWSSF